MKQKLASIALSIAIVFCLLSPVNAHSGRTDGSGGHRDNKNASGLGSYHYHHGYSAHLHPNGICPYAPKDSISVTNIPSSMYIGDSITLKWEVKSSTGSYGVSWVSSDTSVVTVSASGELKALSEGKVSITAKLHNGERTYRFSVKPVLAKTISFGDIPNMLEVEDELSLSAVISPENTTDKAITWKSSNADIASVDPKGNITGVSEGKATITATAKGGAKESVVIEIFEIHPESIAINLLSNELPLNSSAVVSATLLPNNVTRDEIIWESSDEEVVSVVDGKMHAQGIGQAIVTAKCQTVSATAEVTVFEVLPESVSLLNRTGDKIEQLEIPLFTETSVETCIYPENVSNPEITCMISDTSIAILQGGRICGKSAGNTELVLKCQAITKRIPISVYEIKPERIEVDWGEALETKGNKVVIGASLVPMVSIIPKNVTYGDYVIESSDHDIVSIDGNTLTANKTGKATVTFMSGDIRNSVMLKVYDPQHEAFVKVMLVMSGLTLLAGVIWYLCRRKKLEK